MELRCCKDDPSSDFNVWGGKKDYSIDGPAVWTSSSALTLPLTGVTRMTPMAIPTRRISTLARVASVAASKPVTQPLK